MKKILYFFAEGTVVGSWKVYNVFQTAENELWIGLQQNKILQLQDSCSKHCRSIMINQTFLKEERILIDDYNQTI